MHDSLLTLPREWPTVSEDVIRPARPRSAHQVSKRIVKLVRAAIRTLEMPHGVAAAEQDTVGVVAEETGHNGNTRNLRACLS